MKTLCLLLRGSPLQFTYVETQTFYRGKPKPFTGENPPIFRGKPYIYRYVFLIRNLFIRNQPTNLNSRLLCLEVELVCLNYRIRTIPKDRKSVFPSQGTVLGGFHHVPYGIC